VALGEGRRAALRHGWGGWHTAASTGRRLAAGGGERGGWLAAAGASRDVRGGSG